MSSQYGSSRVGSSRVGSQATSLKARADAQRAALGPGLTSQGTAALPSALIFLLVGIEILLRDHVGLISGLAVLLANGGGSWLARRDARRAAAITPPLATLVSLLIWLPIGPSTLSITRLSIDLVSALASLAPYLLVGAAFAWFRVYRK
ncbi:MAG: hypothetical protein WCP54_00785 [Actinomycetes bacterium]